MSVNHLSARSVQLPFWKCVIYQIPLRNFISCISFPSVGICASSIGSSPSTIVPLFLISTGMGMSCFPDTTSHDTPCIAFASLGCHHLSALNRLIVGHVIAPSMVPTYTSSVGSLIPNQTPSNLAGSPLFLWIVFIGRYIINSPNGTNVVLHYWPLILSYGDWTVILEARIRLLQDYFFMVVVFNILALHCCSQCYESRALQYWLLQFVLNNFINFVFVLFIGFCNGDIERPYLEFDLLYVGFV